MSACSRALPPGRAPARFPPLLKSKFGPAVKDFTPEEAALVKGSLDFLGINHYTANYVHANGDPLGFTYSPKSK